MHLLFHIRFDFRSISSLTIWWGYTELLDLHNIRRCIISSFPLKDYARTLHCQTLLYGSRVVFVQHANYSQETFTFIFFPVIFKQISYMCATDKRAVTQTVKFKWLTAESSLGSQAFQVVLLSRDTSSTNTSSSLLSYSFMLNSVFEARKSRLSL